MATPRFPIDPLTVCSSAPPLTLPRVWQPGLLSDLTGLDVTDLDVVAEAALSAWVHLGGLPARAAPAMAATLDLWLSWLPVSVSDATPARLEEFSTLDLGDGPPDLAARRLRLHTATALYLAFDAMAMPLPYLNPLTQIAYPDLTPGPCQRSLSDDEAVLVRLASQSTLATWNRITLRSTVTALALAGAHPAEIPNVRACHITGKIDTVTDLPLTVELPGCSEAAPRTIEVSGWEAERIRSAVRERRLDPTGNDRLAYRGKAEGDEAASSSRGVLTNLLHSSGLRNKTGWIEDTGRLAARDKGADLGPSSPTLWAAADAYQRTGDLDFAAFTLGAVRKQRGKWVLDTARTAERIGVAQ